MKIRLHGRQRTAQAGRAPDTRTAAAEAASVTWARARLREQIQRVWAVTPTATQPANKQTRQTNRAPLADREGRTVTTTGSNITTDMTPVEAAHLLEKVEEGHQAAWLSTGEVPWHSAKYQSRLLNAAEVDGVFRDLMWETLENGMRRLGEPVEEFAERAESEARHADTCGTAAPEPSSGPSAQHADAGLMPGRAGGGQGTIAGRLLNDASTPEGRAYARAFSDTAAAYVRQLRERDPLPETDRTPGAPHPDPFLANRGWHMNDHGLYTRRTEPEASAPPERELEAGS